MRLGFVSFFLGLFTALASAAPGYVGAQVCATCHRDIAQSQSHTNMAQTWHGAAADTLPPSYNATAAEGDWAYRVSRSAAGLAFEVAPAGRPKISEPVEVVVGGRRHGLSFLYRVSEIDGQKLARSALVEGRYLHGSAKGSLLLSPGFPEEKPDSYQTALGRVLSPQFEQKCLTCHGAAKTPGSTETGVHCENCHGPGQDHVASVARGNPRNGIVNPRRMTSPQRVEQCAQCHAGFGELYDPVPDDLLISNQVNAIKNSQCWIQSGGAFDCTSCHDPHRDGGSKERADKACLSCHREGLSTRAALCPVSTEGDCAGCHMPVEKKGSFEMVDHWIRVHPEQNVQAAEHSAALRKPRVLYLRLISTPSKDDAVEALRQLDAKTEFFDVARKFSKDPTALTGGFIGAIEPDKLDPRIASAAVEIDRGAYSRVIDLSGRFAILQRMPRDYLFDAERLELKASAARQSGRLDEAVQTYTEALRVYPQFLRALVFLGVSYGQQGVPARGAAVLEYATRLYPDDPAAQYNLGIAYEALGRSDDAIRVYRRAVQLQPDLVPAYLNLGGALFQAGRLDDAIAAYNEGLNANPLAAALYYNVAQVYAAQNKRDEEARFAAVAGAIDRKFAKRTQDGSRLP